MHLFLTDRIICSRCGPEFGLILLAHEVRDRRVIEGDLGCPNCREKYPIRDGFGDLRPPPREPLSGEVPALDSGPSDPDETLRMAAALGVTEGPGTILIKGPAARFAVNLFDLIGGVEVVGLDPSLVSTAESEGVSRIAADARFPFASGTFRGVLLSGEVSDSDLHEAARVVGAKGRLVVLGASPDVGGTLEALGLRVLLEEDGVLVTHLEGDPLRPLVTLRGL